MRTRSGKYCVSVWYLRILMGKIRVDEEGKPVTPYVTPMTRVCRFTSTL